MLPMPSPGASIAGDPARAGAPFAIYTPVSGTISKINSELKDHPEVVNSDPDGKGWMVVIDLSSTNEVDKLMAAAEYEAFLASQKKGWSQGIGHFLRSTSA